MNSLSFWQVWQHQEVLSAAVCHCDMKLNWMTISLQHGHCFGISSTQSPKEGENSWKWRVRHRDRTPERKHFFGMGGNSGFNSYNFWKTSQNEWSHPLYKCGSLNLCPIEQMFWSYFSSVRSGFNVDNWAIYEIMGLPASIHCVCVCGCMYVCAWEREWEWWK